MLENESILSKSEYEEYKVSLSDVFKPSKKVSQDNFSHYKTNRFISSQNYPSISASNKFGYLYPERIKPINSNSTSASQVIRKKYNLQQQHTIKKTLAFDPFLGLFPDAKKNINTNKTQTKQDLTLSSPTHINNLQETFIVQKIIEKIEKKPEPSNNNKSSVSLYDRIKKSAINKQGTETDLSFIFDQIEKEKSNFSIKIAYETLENNAFSRDLNATPHAYSNLNLIQNKNIIKKPINENLFLVEDRLSLNPTPDNYNYLENQYPVNVYTDLANSLPENRNKNSYSNKKIIYDSSNQINDGTTTTTLGIIEPAKEINNIYELNKINELNTDGFVYKKLNLKKPLHTIAANNRRFSSIRTNINMKNQSKLNKNLKEFKNCIITDVKIGEGEFSETFQGYRYDDGVPSKIAAKRLKKSKDKGENIVSLLAGKYTKKRENDFIKLK